ncbi:MAG: hypothetical protein J0I34_32805 [Pseudonocardia sp.]|uniref:hypothetical protein n=1 Tax=unclassified Pseudonocardia TaxID=2619320 RepID=UPI00086AADEB|nr:MULTISPECIES: hypothetical protein [unclassified Pseudonocardia]MBN9113548.1 hypothetical protein [Pseudonocardia sp.]ODU28934.1 MAG: hypothetical protein ABS80_02145 [Pseudonocardia sp. SCN 72-51]ODU98937.1 MAG: hypothetical protein ABT15_32875 [Pseudonocardia sp. SCN 73-27]
MSESSIVQPAGLVIAPGSGRELPLVGRMAVSGSQTGGVFEIIEFRGNAACPPPHIHREREECIQVLEVKPAGVVCDDDRVIFSFG